MDLPWLNTVDIEPTGYSVNNNFNQYLSQYHSAHLPVFDSLANEMHTVFFGGMSRYTLDPNSGALVDDPDVPFVRTISRVTRFPNGTMDEFEMPVEMPAFIGAGAEFLPLETAPFDEYGILKMNQLPMANTHIGYIFGGIRSSAENIFWVNDGSQSWADTTLFEVWLNPTPTSVEDRIVRNEPLELKLFPNPVQGELSIQIESYVKGRIRITLTDINGKQIRMLEKDRIAPGKHTYPLDTTGMESGIYFVRVQAGSYSRSEKLVIR